MSGENHIMFHDKEIQSLFDQIIQENRLTEPSAQLWLLTYESASNDYSKEQFKSILDEALKSTQPRAVNDEIY